MTPALREIDERPALKWGLVGVQIAAGPATYAIGQAIEHSPLGEFIDSAMGWVNDQFAGRFKDAGYDDATAYGGAAGSTTLGTLLIGASTTKLIQTSKGLNTVSKLRAEWTAEWDRLAKTDRNFVVPQGFERHHVLPLSHERAADARAQMAAWDLDINDPKLNGIALPGHKVPATQGGPIPHQATQNEDYARYVNKLILSAPDAAAAVLRLRKR